jgi:hypothetical protein
LSLSQKLTKDGLYSEEDKCSPRVPIKIYFNIIYPSTPRSQIFIFPSGFPIKIGGLISAKFRDFFLMQRDLTNTGAYPEPYSVGNCGFFFFQE